MPYSIDSLMQGILLFCPFQVREETGARIMFPQQNDREKDSITLMGKEEEVKAAEAKLLAMIKDLVSLALLQSYPNLLVFFARIFLWIIINDTVFMDFGHLIGVGM